MRTKKLGMDTSQTIVLPINEKTMKANYQSIKTELLAQSAITDVSASSRGFTDRSGLLEA